MNAWDILVSNSSAPASSIAWMHLNSQHGTATTGGRADMEIVATSDVIATQADSSGLSIVADNSDLTLTADNKGLTV